MRLRTFEMVDVFGIGALKGNALAVVHDADAMSDDEMDALARWTNLSETVFLLEPSTRAAQYRARIFTPGTELPFAGHPTLGAACAWMTLHGATGDATVVQECGVGLVTIRRRGDLYGFKAPERIRTGPLDDATLAAATAALGLSPNDVSDHQWIDNGPGWAGLWLFDVERLRTMQPGSLPGVYLVAAAPSPPESPFSYELRAFFKGDGPTLEDPVTGSANASMAQWLIETGRMTAPFYVSQGTAIKRDGSVLVETEGDDVWIYGSVRSVVTGSLSLGGH